MNLMVTYEDLKSRIEELEFQLLSKNLKVIISGDDLKFLQRDSLHYFDLNGLSTSNFESYQEVQKLNFSPLQPGGADPQKTLKNRLYRNLRILSYALDRAEELIRKRAL